MNGLTWQELVILGIYSAACIAIIVMCAIAFIKDWKEGRL
jgi:hypothetical protein